MNVRRNRNTSGISNIEPLTASTSSGSVAQSTRKATTSDSDPDVNIESNRDRNHNDLKRLRIDFEEMEKLENISAPGVKK